MPSAMSSGRDNRIARRPRTGEPGNVGTAITHVVHHPIARRLRKPPIRIAHMLWNLSTPL